MHRFMAGLLVVVLFSGCASPGAESANEGNGGSSALPANSIPLPTWTVGDWWTWSSPQQSEAYTSAVSGETGTDYIIDTSSTDIAFYDKRYDVSTVGLMRKSDLAGSQGGSRVEFFKFPLVEHSNWTASWDGLSLKMQVMSIADGIAMVHANRDDGTMYAMYTFLNSSGFFGSIKYYDDAGTEIVYESKVTGRGKNYTGDLVRWELDTLFETKGAIQPGTKTYGVPAGLDDVYAAVTFHCVSGAFLVASGPPQGPADNRGFTINGQCPKFVQFSETIAEGPAQAETWGIAVAAPIDPANFLNAAIWGRTLHTFKVGAAPPLS